MPSLKGNVILNGINTVSSIIFPIITFPYAARVLLPEGIGTINFLNSIIGYIVLFTNLGIPLYAIKEISKFRDNPDKRTQLTIEILLLGFLLSIFGYFAVWILSVIIPEIHEQRSIFFVLSLTILFTTIGVEWFYKALEDFKYITIRALIFRTLAAAALFIFVHSPSDLLIYGFIIVGSTVGNNLINFIHLRKFIKISLYKFKLKGIYSHIKPSIHVFILNLIISLYVSLNPIMLGFLSSEEAVGYFTAGNKISHIGLTLISSVSTVLLPRSAYLLEKGETQQYSNIINKTLTFTQFISYPCTIGLIVLSIPITYLFCGAEYSPSIPVLILTAPVIIFISLTNIMGIQVLFPKNKIKLVIYSVTGGAVLNVILNFILIPKIEATGAAISTLVAEFGVLVLQLILGKKYFPFNLKNIINFKYLLYALIMGLIIFLSISWMSEYWLMVLAGVSIGVLIYSVFLFVMKDYFFGEILSIIRKKF